MTVTRSAPPFSPPTAPVRLENAARLEALAELGLVDEPVNPTLQRLVGHTARLLGVPAAAVSLIDARRHFVAAECGMPEAIAASREIPLSHSPCSHGVRTDAPLVIDDARGDERWMEHPATTELGVGAYCGVPLRTAGGHTVGMLCALDGTPRPWSAADVTLLEDLAATVMAQLELRAANRALAAREAALAASEREMRTIFAAMHDVVLVLDRDGTYQRIVRTTPDLLSRPAEHLLGRRVHDVFARESADRYVEAIRSAIDTGRATDVSYALRVPAGHRHFEAKVTPLGPDTVLWVARDVTTRTEAEAARRASEERLALIYQSASDLMFLIAVERLGGAVTGYRCESVNASYLAVTGLPESAVVGRRLEDVLPPEAAGYARARYDDALASGEVQRYDEHVDLPTGRLVFETTLTPVLDASGTCTHLLGAARDVTARRAADAERVRLSAVLEATPDFVGIAAPDGTCTYLNPAGRRLVGAESDADVIGVSVERIYTPAARAHQATVVRPAAARDGCWSGETTLSGADGRVVPVSQVVVAHRDAGGAVEFFATIMRDLTPVKEAERALRASEARFRAISAASPVGIFEADPDGRARYVNPRLCAIAGTVEGDLLEAGWQGRVHVDDLAPLLRGWTAAASGAREFERVLRLLRPAPDGGPPMTRWVHMRVAAVRDDAGAVVGMVGTVEDVTERRAADAAMQRLTAIIESTPDVVAVATPGGRIDYLNGAGRRLLGIAGGAEAVPAARLTVAKLQPQFVPGGAEYGAVAEALLEGSWSGETVLTRCDGRTIPVEQVLLSHRGADGAVEYLSVTLRDITRRKQGEAALRDLALLDELTQLYNRRGFLTFAERAREAATAAGQSGALFYFDLDAFKPVNDRYGHAEGDRALAAVAGLLRRTFRDSDMVARLGGDEFVAFAPCGSSTVEEAWATVERVCARLDASTAAENAAGARPYPLRFSTGVAVLDPARPQPIAELMAAADAQLYLSKRRRKERDAAE
jgi:diguanylate cyclase (GGDEF)-like protein/PAS domain S-box-containing protein